jgi:hypothetical protein
MNEMSENRGCGLSERANFGFVHDEGAAKRRMKRYDLIERLFTRADIKRLSLFWGIDLSEIALCRGR